MTARRFKQAHPRQIPIRRVARTRSKISSTMCGLVSTCVPQILRADV